MKRKATCKAQNLYVLLEFLLITIVLLTADSTYCYFIKYQVKKHLLPFQVTNNELKEIMYCNINQKMSYKVEHIVMKNHTNYFLDDIINIKNFDPNNIKTNKKSCKGILIYCIGYMKVKDLKCVKINIANPLHIIVSKVNGYFTEIIGNKYLTLVPSKEKVKKKWKLGTKSEI